MRCSEAGGATPCSVFRSNRWETLNTALFDSEIGNGTPRTCVGCSVSCFREKIIEDFGVRHDSTALSNEKGTSSADACKANIQAIWEIPGETLKSPSRCLGGSRIKPFNSCWLRSRLSTRYPWLPPVPGVVLPSTE